MSLLGGVGANSPDAELLADLQITNPSTDLLVLGITGGLPECSSRLVLEGDQGGYPAGAASAQILLAGPGQRDPDALPPMLLTNGEPVQVSSPPIPPGDQSTDDLSVALGNQKGCRGVSDQALDVIQAVCRACVLASLLGP